jgi:trimeric autotransporter adhesin
MRKIFILTILCGLITQEAFSQNAIGTQIKRDSTASLLYQHYNTILGSNAARFSDSSYTFDENTIIGSRAGYNLGKTTEPSIYTRYFKGNTYVGAYAGYSRKGSGTFTPWGDTYIGAYAGHLVTNGQGSTLVGFEAGAESEGMYRSVNIGYGAGRKFTKTNCVLIGYEAGSLNNGNTNVKIGAFAGKSASGNDNTMIGATAGGEADISSPENVFIGSYAGSSARGNLSINTPQGGRNVMIGAYTGQGTLGDGNVFIGANAAGANKRGNGNVMIGLRAGQNNIQGQKNTFLGMESGVAVVDSNLTNATAIGYQAIVSVSNSIVLGGTGANAVKVGIGNTAPQNKLEITSATTNTSGLRFTNLKSTSTPATTNNLALSVDANGDVILVPSGGALPAGADVWDQLTNGADYLIRNKNNKSVMIGTVAATKTSIDYKLYVEKGILAEKVKVSVQANWPDYVFGKDYSLMPLKEVENYITTNNHLPEVPSAEVIAKDGLDLGKMDATLLKKVEELTLYLIEQSKKIEVLQNELSTLKAKK